MYWFTTSLALFLSPCEETIILCNQRATQGHEDKAHPQASVPVAGSTGASGTQKGLCKSGSRTSLDVDEGEHAEGSSGHCVGTGSRPWSWGAPWSCPHSPQAFRDPTGQTHHNLHSGLLTEQRSELISWIREQRVPRGDTREPTAVYYLILLSTVCRKYHVSAQSRDSCWTTVYANEAVGSPFLAVGPRRQAFFASRRVLAGQVLLVVWQCPRAQGFLEGEGLWGTGTFRLPFEDN